MIDIHCHILPGIDDGPKDWDTSLEIIKLSISEGISQIIATPHWVQGTNWETDSVEIIDKVHYLNKRLEKENIDLEVFPGMEVAITDSLVDLVKVGEVLTLAGTNCLLLEMPFRSLPLGLETIIEELLSNDIIPILAHPERNADFQNNPKSIKKFIDLGSMVQVTSTSFIGSYGKEAQRCAIEFSKLNIVDFIATDAHSPVRRPPFIKESLNIWKKHSKGDIKKLIDDGYKKLGIN